MEAKTQTCTLGQKRYEPRPCLFLLCFAVFVGTWTLKLPIQMGNTNMLGQYPTLDGFEGPVVFLLVLEGTTCSGLLRFSRVPFQLGSKRNIKRETRNPVRPNPDLA